MSTNRNVDPPILPLYDPVLDDLTLLPLAAIRFAMYHKKPLQTGAGSCRILRSTITFRTAPGVFGRVKIAGRRDDDEWLDIEEYGGRGILGMRKRT